MAEGAPRPQAGGAARGQQGPRAAPQLPRQRPSVSNKAVSSTVWLKQLKSRDAPKMTQRDHKFQEVSSPEECALITSNRVRQNQVLIVLHSECLLPEWRLSDEDMVQLHKDIDDNEDGHVDRAEISGWLQEPKARACLVDLKGPLRALLNPLFVTQAFDLMDKNKDGKVDQKEWIRFGYVASWRKLRFLEMMHHLRMGCFWGYGSAHSLPTPHAFWEETQLAVDYKPERGGGRASPPSPGGTDPRVSYEYSIWTDTLFEEEGYPLLGQSMDSGDDLKHRKRPKLPDWETEVAYRLCCGMVELPHGWGSDLWYFECQNHTLLSLFFVDEDHPFDPWERLVLEFTMWGWTLMMLASRDWLSALMVAQDLPSACRADSTDFWDCVHHNCICRPGFLDNCRVLNCAAQADRNATGICHDYGAVDPEGKLCFGSLYNRHAWLVWAPLYVTFFITFPGLIIQRVLVFIYSSPCTVRDVTSPVYKPSWLDTCMSRMEQVWKVLFFLIACTFWAVALYMTYTRMVLRIIGYPADQAYDWAPDRWDLLLVFLLGRVQFYVFQTLGHVLVQFNPFGAVYDPAHELKWRLRWWASLDNCVGRLQVRWIQFGRWHSQRHRFLRKKYQQDRQIDPEAGVADVEEENQRALGMTKDETEELCLSSRSINSGSGTTMRSPGTRAQAVRSYGTLPSREASKPHHHHGHKALLEAGDAHHRHEKAKEKEKEKEREENREREQQQSSSSRQLVPRPAPAADKDGAPGQEDKDGAPPQPEGDPAVRGAAAAAGTTPKDERTKSRSASSSTTALPVKRPPGQAIGVMNPPQRLPVQAAAGGRGAAAQPGPGGAQPGTRRPGGAAAGSPDGSPQRKIGISTYPRDR
eukprot:TRINITY_DN5292_c0_g2_i1.p1 TRINITY_DN5292_c0_g2~~TRINITY_DN5292_c0_g2_i1.p1  ORF type:complete len:900 (+),score=241.59 TRINITY_DN5292_c0_g2_i1:107-2701(+)